MKTKLATLILLALFTTGCLPAAIAYSAHRISESRSESAKTTAQASETIAYANYKTRMEAINFHREKNNMKPAPILSLEEWKTTLQ